jgi:DNA topoisomerase-1
LAGYLVPEGLKERFRSFSVLLLAMSQRHSVLVQSLAKELGLTIVGLGELTLRRRRCGKGFVYCTNAGSPVRHRQLITRLKSLAVPPAYTEVRFANDPSAHLQAVGVDSAGRLQYRYHPKWTDVREAIKARRLSRLCRSLPAIRRAVEKGLASPGCTVEFAVASVVRMVDRSAIRAGHESYARERGTRGATTLLKSNVTVRAETVTLEFKAKGGKAVRKEMRDRRLAKALKRMMALPGRRLFQYRLDDGTIRSVRASEVNAFLREIVGGPISLKDFRTLMGSTGVLDALVAVPVDSSRRKRGKQLRAAVADVAEELANTPTVCRKSYVHAAVIAAFEDGKLSQMNKPRSSGEKAALLARLAAWHAGLEKAE